MKKQFGGTVVGLMIGVVLGLAAALAVAVYVTKTPPTFANKGQSHTAESDATESKKNKDWDPNTPLYGKNPAKPNMPVVPGATVTPDVGADGKVSVPVTTATSTASTTTTTTAAPTKPAGTATVTSLAAANKPTTTASNASPTAAVKPDAKSDTKTTSSDPLGDLAKAKSTPKSSNPSAEPFMYFVQAGAFRTAEDAEAQRVRLSLMGVDAKVSEREQSGRTVFRVRSGPYNKEDDADRMKEKLSGAGMDAALVRVQR